jgi:hypothetical protein
MRVYNLVVQTYEEGNPIPVVTHTFHGKSPTQARVFYRAHLIADAFMRGCKKGRFATFKCRNVVHPITSHEVQV